MGSAFKDRGLVDQGISCYQKAISLNPNFYIALANLANVFKDIGRVQEAIDLYRRALHQKPGFIEAFCNYVNSLLFICDWNNRDEHLNSIKKIVIDQLNESPANIPTVLPFHTFTYSSLPPWMVREISRRNANKVLWNVESSQWFPGFNNDNAMYPYPLPPVPIGNEPIRIGYVSSDFTNHPLAHLMQSVFTLHSKKIEVYCYALSPNDSSSYRATIESGAHKFLDVSNWAIERIVEQIVADKIHVLCNLNGIED